MKYYIQQLVFMDMSIACVYIAYGHIDPIPMYIEPTNQMLQCFKADFKMSSYITISLL